MAINFESKRRLRNFQNRKVRESLPEIYTSDFPKLVTFLEKYYQFLDSSDASSAFGDDLRQGFARRDIHETQTNLLNNLVSEFAGGLRTGENFTDTRYALTRLAQLARHKGTRFSIEEFFRLFFQEVPVVEYGKDQIFTVGQSQIGPESLRFLQNNALFQVFSILIKIGLDTSKWSELYKKFVHPAGFYFQGEVALSGEATNFPTGDVVTLADSTSISLVGEGAVSLFGGFVQPTILLDSDGKEIRAGINQLVSVYQNLSAEDLTKFYSSIDELIGVNSFTFDDSDIRDSAGTATPDFSLATETMDNEMFTRYLSDSSI